MYRYLHVGLHMYGTGTAPLKKRPFCLLRLDRRALLPSNLDLLDWIDSADLRSWYTYDRPADRTGPPPLGPRVSISLKQSSACLLSPPFLAQRVLWPWCIWNPLPRRRNPTFTLRPVEGRELRHQHLIFRRRTLPTLGPI